MGGQCFPPFQSGKKSETFSEMFILKYKKGKSENDIWENGIEVMEYKKWFSISIILFSPFSELSV